MTRFGQFQHDRLKQVARIIGLWAIAPIVGASWAIAATAQDTGDISEQLSSSSLVDQVAQADQLAPATPVEITNIQLEPSADGLLIQIETSSGETLTPTTSTTGNALTVEIPNAILALPDGDEFLEFEPADGIAVVQAIAL
ncbi:MAG: AMIN domain-containing protein, partial [Cyanophyceae cyanobacterium]